MDEDLGPALTDQSLSKHIKTLTMQIKKLLFLTSGIYAFQEGILMQCARIISYQIHGVTLHRDKDNSINYTLTSYPFCMSFCVTPMCQTSVKDSAKALEAG